MSFDISLPVRFRAMVPLSIYVNPAGTDDPNHGLSWGLAGEGAFATPGYAVAWCGANLDAALQPVQILVDAVSVPYTVTPVPKAVGGITLCDILGAVGSWTQWPIKIAGAINGVPVTTGPQDGPILSFDGISAVCGVGVNTVWQLEYLQLQSTVADVLADRGSKINVSNIACGAFANPYPSPQKFSGIYGGSVEILGPTWINAGGDHLWSALNDGEIIAVGGIPAPVIAPGVSFTQITDQDATSSLSLPPGWPR